MRGKLVSMGMGALMTLAGLAPVANASASSGTTGAFYTMTNAPTGNAVEVFDRDVSGMLDLSDTVSTEGLGSGGGGDPLGSQGSLTLSKDNRWLLAVNAGSNDFSVLQVKPHGIEFSDKISSGGTKPVSVAVNRGLVYVLNVGGTPNISGFTLSNGGQLTSLAGSTRALPAGVFSQVGFDPEGNWLVVTDRSANTILTFAVGSTGLPSAAPVTSPSAGIAPFGLAFDQEDHLLVVEAGSNAVSSYSIMPDGSLTVISASVANGQTAACWIANDARGDVYTANPGTASISAYSDTVDTGSVTLDAGVAAPAHSLDIAVSGNSRFLYGLDPSHGGIDMYRISGDGSLVSMSVAAGGLAGYAQGAAAR